MSLLSIALRDKKTPEEFKKAAQKHANASWLYLIISGLVYYFYGWHWASIPFLLFLYVAYSSIQCTILEGKLSKNYERDAKIKHDSKLAHFEALKIMHGHIITAYPNHFYDLTLLPAPKADMKDAYKALYLEADIKERELLHIAYQELSRFMPGVGSVPIAAPIIKDTGDMDAVARLSVEWAEWTQKSLAEMLVLDAEFKDFLATEHKK
jgi:hypothetical protein